MMRSILEEEAALELQHVNVKLLLENPNELDLSTVVNVFHSWIQGQVCEELLLDVADYRHVHHGTGIVLIGHEADYAIDNTSGRWGVRYNRKAKLEGSNQSRLVQSVRAALVAAERLQQDARLHGKFNFNGQEIEIFVNDRLLAPNRPQTKQVLQSEFHAFAGELFGDVEYTLNFETDTRRLFGGTIKANRRLRLADLLENLSRRENAGYDVV